MAAAAQQSASPIVIAPTIVGGTGNGGATAPTLPPQRIMTENPEVAVQALRSVNVI